MNINLGTYGNDKSAISVQWRPYENMNAHMCILGSTGSGKSVEAQRIVTQIIEQGGTVLSFDFHSIWAEEQIFEKYKNILFSYSHEINADRKGIQMDLFQQYTYPGGYEESQQELITNLTDIFCNCFNFGVKQRTLIYSAFQTVFERKMYATKGLSAVYEILHNSDDSLSEYLAQRIEFITSANLISCSEGSYIASNKFNIVRVSSYSLIVQELATELLLYDMWRKANKGMFVKQPIFIVIDEFQNIRGKILPTLIAEGRKFGVNLIMITQATTKTANRLLYERIMQCGLILFFRPPVDRNSEIAKILAPENHKPIVPKLDQLTVGEFFTKGQVFVGNNPYNEALKVSAKE